MTLWVVVGLCALLTAEAGCGHRRFGGDDENVSSTAFNDLRFEGLEPDSVIASVRSVAVDENAAVAGFLFAPTCRVLSLNTGIPHPSTKVLSCLPIELAVGSSAP